MADLARIKRNVAKMASMNAPEEDIDGYIESEGVTIDDVRNYRELQPMTEEQKAEALRAQKQWKESFNPKLEEGGFSEALVTNPYLRTPGFIMQGISNASLNPAGYVARAAGIDTSPLEAENAGERVAELAGQYGYDAAALVPALKAAGVAYPAVAPYIAPLTEGGIPLALRTSTGSALATGIIDPENPYARMGTDFLGGGLAMGFRPRTTAAKKDIKTVKQLEKEIGKDVLKQDIAEAERTGRSLLEVGGEEILDAAQRAKQRTPAAKNILKKYMDEAVENQPTRTADIINKALGTQGKNATIARVMKNAQEQARPLYKQAAEKIYAANDAELNSAITNNDVIKDAISSVKRSYSSLKNLPDNDAGVIIQARELLSKQSISPDPTKAFEARQGLKELDPILSRVTENTLGDANKLYSGAHQFKEAADLGKDVFNINKSPEDLKMAWESLSLPEKQAAKIGLREEMTNKIGSSLNEANALNRFLPKNTREKIITIAGENEGRTIIDEAEQAVKLRNAYNELFKGSKTAEKQNLRDTIKGVRGVIKKPWENTVDFVFNPFENKTNIKTAEYLTDPNLTNTYRSVKNAKKVRYYPQGIMRATFEQINKEED